MATALDANVLLRFTVRQAALHPVVRSAVRSLRDQGERLCLLPQNLYEFWNVGTRPASARGGFGMSITAADHNVVLLERVFDLLPDTPAVYNEWRRLVVSHGVSGVQTHDARIAAAMRVHGVARLLTFNTKDFTRYPGIMAVDPANV